MLPQRVVAHSRSSCRLIPNKVAHQFVDKFILDVNLGPNLPAQRAHAQNSSYDDGELSVDFFDFVPTGTLARRRCFSLRCRRSAFWYPTNPARAVLAIHPNVRRLFLSEETRRVAVVADIHLRLLWRQLLNQIVLRQNFPDSLP